METAPRELVVAVLPVLGVEPGHVAEARRALLEQGRSVDDASLTRLLWAARALPAALDALADAAVSGARAARLGAPEVDVGDKAAVGPLVAVARLDDDTVTVEILEQRALLAAADDDAAPLCVVTIPLSRVDVAADVAVHRFTIGPP